MNHQNPAAEQALTQLFHGFVDAGLHGRFEEALRLTVEPYLGVGMGEQGMVCGKVEAERILRDSYLPAAGTLIAYKVNNLKLNWLSESVAVLLGEVIVTTTPPDKKPLRSGMMQTIVVRLENGCWRIAFTHSSPTLLTAESVEAYPIRFMDHTLSALRAELQTETSLYRDPLTGILNREGLERCSAKLLREYQPKHSTAFFMLDLDDFKQINDRLGHQTGDTVLQQVAEALRNAFCTSAAVSRIGGDEFVVLITGNFSVKFLEKKADELLHSMRLRMDDSHEVPISISIGIAYGRARATFETLYRIADIALYTAKKAGKCRYHLIHCDTNAQRAYRGSNANLLSLQTLLDFMDGRELAESTASYRALVEHIPGGIAVFEMGDTLRVTHYGTWLERLVGCPSCEEIGKVRCTGQLDLLIPADRPKLEQALRRIREDGINQLFLPARIQCKDGAPRAVELHGSVFERTPERVTLYVLFTDSSAGSAEK